ncbi:hypothetical protein GPECTOR_21g747 [Gonium pectorale]|uniref:SGNH hydrolase-type esterase domain-containing protein n=1 Tax=Gonium pectorale TaxID=33097 RepID=A0A150GI67_GONPE|nr:hypothetical protein GPECTOR_21g747 [Gonium pectorale]|eukprot:KXZ49521.1 hypothetical protein GPECTOR_21g747 [Gonium pectorale]
MIASLKVALLLSAISLLHRARCYQRATAPRLDNLTASEVYYAKLYWANRPADRVVPVDDSGAAIHPRRVRLGYRFIVPLPERLAGLTYVGHAARLRLALERARRGTQSGYMSSCLQHHLPPGVDVVLLEYAVNDPPTPSPTLSDPSRRAFERLVRKVLSLPSRPAVVLVNMYAAGAAKGRYWHNAERDFNELASYYGLPSVSLKAAVVPSAASTPAVSLGAIFNSGKHHPGRGGHVVAAELLITLAQDVLASSARLSAAAADAKAVAAAGNGAPAVEGGGNLTLGLRHHLAAPGGGGAADAGLSADAAAALEAVASRPLPPPSLVQQPAEGWRWTDEGRGKWGWVALEAKRTLRIQVNTQLPGARGNSSQAAAARIVLQVAYLQSYSGMGRARLSCVSGCGCEPLDVDAHSERRVSVTAVADVKVSQSPECVLALSTRGPSAAAAAAARREGAEGGGNKFKLLGVVVGEEPGASGGGVTWLRGESHSMAHLVRAMRTLPPGASVQQLLLRSGSGSGSGRA